MYDGAIRIKTRIDNTGAEKGINTLSGSLKKFAGMVGIAFGVSAIVNFSKVAVNEASKMQSALIGLQSILDGQGKSFNKAQAFINNYISDGLIPMNDAVTAYKNLALRGYDDSQIQKTLISLKDASAFGRNASLSMGEAVSSATEGLKNENSILVDNAGVTKNVAKMWDDYAKSIGKSTSELTKQDKIQAEIVGIMEETKYQTGDAIKYADTYAGSVAKFNATLITFKQNLGSLLQGLFKGIMQGATVVIKGLNNLVLMIGTIFEAFTGKNPLNQMTTSSEKTAGDFDSVASSLDDSSKSAKEIKKSLAGFDEMNVLSDNSLDKTENSTKPITPPTSVIKEPNNINKIGNDFEKVAKKIKKIIKDLMPLIKGIIASVTTFFALKGIKFALEQIENFRYQWKLLTMALKDGKAFNALKGNTDILMTGISLIIGGTVALYETIKKVNNDWSEMDTGQKVLTVSMGILEVAVIGLGIAFTAAWAGATMGLSVLIGTIGAIVVAIGTLIVASNAQTESHKKEMEELRAETEMQRQLLQLHDERNQQIKDGADGKLAEITHIQKLNAELQTLVDSNGKIIAGNEDRVNFILSELNPAVGEEIKVVDGIIQNYAILEEKIHKVLEIKKAEIMLGAEEEKYREAVLNSGKSENEMNESRKKYLELYENYAEETNSKEKKRLQEKVEESLKNYKKSTENYIKYQEDMKKYEDSYVAFQNGNYDEVKRLYDKDIEWKKSYNEKIGETEKEKNNIIKKAYENSLNDQEKQLNTQLDKLEKQQEERSKSMYKSNYTRGIDIGANLIEGQIQGIKNKQGSLYAKIQETAQKTIKEMKNELGIRSPSKVFRKLGDYTGQGYILGLEDEEKNIEKAINNMVTIPKIEKNSIKIPIPKQPVRSYNPMNIPLKSDYNLDSFNSNNSKQPINIYLPNGKLLAQYVIDTIKKQDFTTNGGVL